MINHCFRSLNYLISSSFPKFKYYICLNLYLKSNFIINGIFSHRRCININKSILHHIALRLIQVLIRFSIRNVLYWGRNIILWFFLLNRLCQIYLLNILIILNWHWLFLNLGLSGCHLKVRTWPSLIFLLYLFSRIFRFIQL
jgi:hypothetical protein